MRVVIIPTDRSPYRAVIGSELTDMQWVVGGFIEGIAITGDHMMWCNEEAKLVTPRPPRNEVAIALTEGVHEILGTVFIAGIGDVDISDEMAARLCNVVSLPMPNETVVSGAPGAHTVIASCFGSDDEGVNHLLLLNTTPGRFYSTAQQDQQTGDILIIETFANVVPAAQAYQEDSGAWDGE